jgi:hypothetical protein
MAQQRRRQEEAALSTGGAKELDLCSSEETFSKTSEP